MIYTVGAVIVIESLVDRTQRFLYLFSHYFHFICFRFGHTQPIGCLSLSPDKMVLASGSIGGEISSVCLRLWDLSTLAPMYELVHHKSNVLATSFSADSSMLLSIGDSENIVCLWNVQRVYFFVYFVLI